MVPPRGGAVFRFISDEMIDVIAYMIAMIAYMIAMIASMIAADGGEKASKLPH